MGLHFCSLVYVCDVLRKEITDKIQCLFNFLTKKKVEIIHLVCLSEVNQSIQNPQQSALLRCRSFFLPVSLACTCTEQWYRRQTVRQRLCWQRMCLKGEGVTSKLCTSNQIHIRMSYVCDLCCQCVNQFFVYIQTLFLRVRQEKSQQCQLDARTAKWKNHNLFCFLSISNCFDRSKWIKNEWNFPTSRHARTHVRSTDFCCIWFLPISTSILFFFCNFIFFFN